MVRGCVRCGRPADPSTIVAVDDLGRRSLGSMIVGSAGGVRAGSVRSATGRRYRHGVDRRFLRPGWIAGHVLVFLAFLTCLRLGWWQWDRSHAADGTAQNLGYALLWPAFGAAFIYMWLRFLHLEVLKDEQDAEDDELELDAILDGTEPEDGQTTAGDPADGQPVDASAAEPDATTEQAVADVDPEPDIDQARRARRRQDLQRPSQGVTISIATVGDEDDEDPELTAYNQALAALAEEDRRRAR